MCYERAIGDAYNLLSVNSVPSSRTTRALLALALALGAAGVAGAQTLPSEPIVIGGGRLTIGGDVSATMSCAQAEGGSRCTEDTGFFNYTDYYHSSVRMLRVDVAAALTVTRHVSILGEVRSEDAGWPQPYALYVRVRPWVRHRFDIQAGRIPPTFGAFARRTYAADNLLIGYPLAYQYLTSLRPDALPADADELLRMRGRGWLSSFSIGERDADRGVPLVSAFRWDTGVQVHAGNDVVEGAAAVTAGTLANPLVSDDNSGKQIAGRVAVRPFTGLAIGASGARGPFPTRAALQSAGVDRGTFAQSAWGGDIEYSRGYYLIRAEAVVSQWRLPIVRSPNLSLPLRATGTSVEGRYKIRPGLYAAARADHLGFSEITGSSGADAWDAPVTRVELGGGYAVQRNLLLKVSFQRNTRDGGRVTKLNVGAAQLVFWF